MPRTSIRRRRNVDSLSITNLPELNAALGGGFRPGDSYVLTGRPGVYISRLALAVVTESLGSEYHALTINVHADAPAGVAYNADSTSPHVRVLSEDKHRVHSLTLGGTEVDLATLVSREVKARRKHREDVRVVVIDLTEADPFGLGWVPDWLNPHSLIEQAQTLGIALLFTKEALSRGRPGSADYLEEVADWVLEARRAFRCYALEMPRRKAASSQHEPILVAREANGRLVELPGERTPGATTYGFDGCHHGFTCIQAAMGLQPETEEPTINAAPDAEWRVKHLIATLAELPGLDTGGLSYFFGHHGDYQPELDLAFAVELLSGYLRRRVPPRTLFVGALGERLEARPPEDAYLAALAKSLILQRGEVRTVYVSYWASSRLAAMEYAGQAVGSSVDVRGIGDLPSLLGEMWPTLFGTASVGAGQHTSDGLV